MIKYNAIFYEYVCNTLIDWEKDIVNYRNNPTAYIKMYQDIKLLRELKEELNSARPVYEYPDF